MDIKMSDYGDNNLVKFVTDTCIVEIASVKSPKEEQDIAAMVMHRFNTHDQHVEEIRELREALEVTRVSMLQYDSLRTNFQNMVNDVLGEDYYVDAYDVYDADKALCEAITKRANGKKGFIKKLLEGKGND